MLAAKIDRSEIRRKSVICPQHGRLQERVAFFIHDEFL